MLDFVVWVLCGYCCYGWWLVFGGLTVAGGLDCLVCGVWCLFYCLVVGLVCVLLVVCLDFVLYVVCFPMGGFVLVCFYNLGDSLCFGAALRAGLRLC